jgi:hypothetical protein
MNSEDTVTKLILVGMVYGQGNEAARGACAELVVTYVNETFPPEERFAVVKRCKERAMATYRAGPAAYVERGLATAEIAETSEAIH